MNIIVPKNYEEALITKTDQDLARIGHVNRLIEAFNKIPSFGAIQLLGSKIGFNLNPIQTVSYANLVGGTFQVGDIITDSTSGSTAEVVSDNGINSMVIKKMNGPLLNTETFDNGSGVSAEFTNDYYIPEEIIEIETGYVSDALITNASGMVVNATNIFISSLPNRGSLLAQSGGNEDALRVLSTPDKFIQGILNKFAPTVGDIKYTLYNNRPDRRSKVSGKLYVSVIGEGDNLTCDVYVYGRTLK